MMQKMLAKESRIMNRYKLHSLSLASSQYLISKKGNSIDSSSCFILKTL